MHMGCVAVTVMQLRMVCALLYHYGSVRWLRLHVGDFGGTVTWTFPQRISQHLATFARTWLRIRVEGIASYMEPCVLCCYIWDFVVVQCCKVL